MQVIKKCYICSDKNELPHYSQEIHAKTAGQARGIFVSSRFSNGKFTDITCKRKSDLDIVRINGKEGTFTDLEREERTLLWRESLRKLESENPNAKVRIYSGEHALYWRSNKSGYTSKIANAGIYDISDAVKFVIGCCIEKDISLEIVI